MTHPIPLALVVIFSGCATFPDAEPVQGPTPILKMNSRVDWLEFPPSPNGERMLFCIEGPDRVVCMAEKNGRARSYVFLPPPPKNGDA